MNDVINVMFYYQNLDHPRAATIRIIIGKSKYCYINPSETAKNPQISYVERGDEVWQIND
jgi:hypothetical protein